MEKKLLGKITEAEFGFTEYLMGLKLSFGGPGWCVSDGGRFSMNMSSTCRYEAGEKAAECQRVMDKVAEILKDAKVEHVSELAGKPVEVIIKSGTFHSVRILTEVL